MLNTHTHTQRSTNMKWSGSLKIFDGPTHGDTILDSANQNGLEDTNEIL